MSTVSLRCPDEILCKFLFRATLHPRTRTIPIPSPRTQDSRVLLRYIAKGGGGNLLFVIYIKSYNTPTKKNLLPPYGIP